MDPILENDTEIFGNPNKYSDSRSENNTSDPLESLINDMNVPKEEIHERTYESDSREYQDQDAERGDKKNREHDKYQDSESDKDEKKQQNKEFWKQSAIHGTAILDNILSKLLMWWNGTTEDYSASPRDKTYLEKSLERLLEHLNLKLGVWEQFFVALGTAYGVPFMSGLFYRIGNWFKGRKRSSKKKHSSNNHYDDDIEEAEVIEEGDPRYREPGEGMKKCKWSGEHFKEGTGYPKSGKQADWFKDRSSWMSWNNKHNKDFGRKSA